MTKKMTLIYVLKNQQTLFLERAMKSKDEISVNKFLGVGGKVDPSDRTIYEAACREMMEETNLQANKLIRNGMVTFIGQREYDVETTVYICSDFDGELQGDNREGTLHWIDNYSIGELNMWEGDKEFIPMLFEPGEFNIKLYYKDNKLQNIVHENEFKFEIVAKCLEGALLYQGSVFTFAEKMDKFEVKYIKGIIFKNNANWYISIGDDDDYYDKQYYILEVEMPDLFLNFQRNDSWANDSQDYPIISKQESMILELAIKNK